MKIIALNKKASFNYHLLDSFSAGLELQGTEVKALREGLCQLKDSYISFRGNELFLQKAHIGAYKAAGASNHEPERLRKLLLHRHEIDKIKGRLQKKGLTCIPTKIFFQKGKAKLEIRLAQGKKKWDKRESLKKKSQEREMARHLKK